MKRTATCLAAAALVAAPMASTIATAEAAKPAAYSITAKVNKTVVVVGSDVVNIRGKVTPRAAAPR